MTFVQSGKKWNIQNREDYDAAMKTLDENEFMAEMSDDFYAWQIEKDEVASQRYEVRRQALTLGIITETEDINRHWKS